MIKLPNSYRFTEADVDRGCDIFVRYMEDKPVTADEMQLQEYTTAVWVMFCQTRKWPSVAEVSAQLRKEAEEAERRWVASFTPEAQKKYWEEKQKAGTR